MSLIIVFGKGHALLLVGTRFRQPPILRQMAGQNADNLPPVTRRDAARLTGKNAAGHPPIQLAKVPGNFPEIAEQLFRDFPPVIRSIIGMLTPLCRRITAVMAGVITGHFPIHFRAYA